MIFDMKFKIRFERELTRREKVPRPSRFTVLADGEEITFAYISVGYLEDQDDPTVIDYELRDADLAQYPEMMDLDLFSIEKFTEFYVTGSVPAVEVINLCMTDESGVTYLAEPEVHASASEALTWNK